MNINVIYSNTSTKISGNLFNSRKYAKVIFNTNGFSEYITNQLDTLN